ncbi:ribosome maturation factor RimP [Corynebacterium breve]|uniref:Ribosome maturation factor RimP n=1 Tax=Corynebacterium breve TaxID=3049799 RepID=A0ABY8VB00_9CORY|nr:ribosome maturation factor RimP [Corynebacterium breve]WIM66836.1 ribosome maturation factor RimP [Corynebacterium breve]
MAFPSSEELQTLITPVASQYNMDVERIKITKAGKKSVVAIALDSDSRPTLDELEEVSNEISALFDEHEERGELNFGAGYSLEVTTPGIDHPLTLPRHWRRNRGRLVTLTDDNGNKTQWRIGALSDDEQEVALISHEPKGGKNLRVDSVRVSDSVRAVVEIEFSNPPATEAEIAEEPFEEAMKRREDNK